MHPYPARPCTGRSGAAGRLDQVKNGANNRFNYAWDLHNNRTSMQENTGSIQTFTYDAGDRLTSRTNPTTSFTYDAAGNTTGDGTNTYQWDYAGNLKKITHPGGSTEFTYDGLRRRVRIVEKNAGGATLSDHRYLWCGAEICQKRSGTTGGTVAKVYFPHGVVDGGTPYYYTFDHLGSVREVVNTSGAVVARYQYEPFG